MLGLPAPRYLHVPVATDERGEKLSKQTLASPVDARDAGGILATALGFLGQPRPASPAPDEILAQARECWDAARIPRRRERVAARKGEGPTPPGV
jgi:glutamyl-Q tRNA(Asp) synthetase